MIKNFNTSACLRARLGLAWTQWQALSGVREGRVAPTKRASEQCRGGGLPLR